MRTVLAFLRLGRLPFLTGGFVFHALGTAMALYQGAALNPGAFFWGQVAVTSTQLATHYSNEYFDLRADRTNPTPTRWSGGSRVLPDGELPPRVALVTAILLSLMTLVAARTLATTQASRPLAAPLILTALFLAWAYSAPPLALHSRGLGELTTAVLVPGLTPLLGYYTQTGRIDALPLLAAFPLGCFQFAMLLTIEFPDQTGDAAVGKNTLVVSLGASHAAQLYQGMLLAAYGSLPLLLLAGLPLGVTLATLTPFPIAVLQWRRMAARAWGNPAAWNRLAFTSVALLMLTAGLQLLAFTLLIGLA